MNELRGEYTIVDTNEKVTITRKGAKKVTSHSVDNVVHLKSIAAIPQMLENAIFIEESAAEKENAKYDTYRYYVCGLRIGNNDYTVRITIGVKGGKYYYDHSLTSIEKGNLIEIAQGFTPNGGLTLPSYAESKDKRIIPILQTNSSKIVDENGEPKVVWHGGQFGISSFIPRQNMHFGTKKAAMQRILDEQWGYNNWLVQNEDGSYSWKYGDEYDEAYNVQSNRTFATEEEAMEDALLYFGNEVVVKPYFLNIRNIERTDDVQSSWDDAIEVVKAESDNVDGIVYENWYEDKGSDSYIAFNPNQIKSATDNVGTYNANNPDIRFSLITPEMDAAYLSAVERGDMDTAQQMVIEAAKLAMPNTKVVDENGNALVGYYGDRMKARYKLCADIFFTLHSNYARLYIIA